MLSRFRHVFGVVFFLIIASCSGGGCSGCGGCGGTTPLPGGFPKDKAVENAASVRVSRPGLDFVEQNLPAIASKTAGATNGTLNIPIPDTDLGTQTLVATGKIGGSYALKVDLHPHICPGGPDATSKPPKCEASVGIGKSTFKIDAVKPNAVQVSASIPLELDNTPVTASASGDVAYIGYGPINMTIHAAYGANGSCNGATPTVSPKALPVAISIPLVEETIAPRNGYTKIDVANASIDLSAISGNDVQLCADCGGTFLSSACDYILNAGFVKNFLVGQLKSGLEGQVRGMLESQLCTAPNAALNPPCPTGSKPDAKNAKCVYDSKPDTCVPMLLGTDAHIDLGGFLRAISPGTAGGLDFGLASAGAMNPAPGANADGSGRTPNGITLGMMGGALPQPPSKCVPQVDVTPPTGIPVPDELAPTKPDAAGTPHVGIALAGRFLDYSMASVYNSGLLCLGVSTEQFDMLKSGLLSLLVPSIKTLTFEQNDAAAAIATRPQAPPTITIGGGTDANADPLLAVHLPKFALDFYIWSYDRFVRTFTFQGDLTIPVNLQTSKDGITPVLGDMKVDNGAVTNADLLMDDPVLISNALSGLLGAVSKQLVGGGISPVNLSSALSSVGLGLDVTKIGKLHKGSDDYVGIFANMSKAAGTATVEADTKASLISKTVHADKMQLTTITKESLPELDVEVSSPLDDGRHAIEYSWRIDHGTRSAWSRDRRFLVKDDQLILQGKHVLYVAARVVGEPETEDATPAEVPFTIDALAPFVKVDREGAAAKVSAWDLVSSTDALVGRYALDGAPLGAWVPVSELAKIDVGSAASIDVEVKDEEGNIGKVQQGLIRGRDDASLAAAGSGCGCSTPGSRDAGGGSGPLALVLGLGALGFIAIRRRTRAGAVTPRFTAALAIGTIGAVAATSQGCACGSEAQAGQACGHDCNQECKPALAQGLPGSYTSVAKAQDGTLWVAGYNDALLSEGDSMLWGDLVVGKYDLGKERVEWQTVDGIPTRDDGTCPDYPRDSWRNGETDSGDDVGLWTSIQIGSQGHPMVSYYDATNKRLKFAIEDNGWQISVLREVANGDAGRYSKMILVDGKPVIAFMQSEPGDNGKARSRVVVARATTDVPHGPSDFTFEDAAVVEDNPCSASTCTGGQVCVKSTGTCTPTVGGCTPADCGTGKACVTDNNAASCVAVQGTIETYPNVFGGYIALASGPSGLGIAVYDRPHGNLVALVDKGNGQWDRVVVDGETGSRADNTAIDTGDDGIATSLSISPDGVWHMSYVNGIDETLRYVTLGADGKPGKSEIVDDGSSVDGKPFPDGQHVVGDDSAVRVDGDIVTIYYQDATVGMLRRASGTLNGATHTWDLRALPQPDKFAGFFPQLVPGEDKVTNFWRQTDRNAKTVVGDVTVVTP